MKQDFTDGYRGRIGLVATAPGNAAEADFNRYRPQGVAVMTTRTPLTSSTPEGIGIMNAYMEDAVRMLAENAYCDVILLSSTAGSFLDGKQADQEKAAALSQRYKARVLTSAQCMERAFSALSIQSVTLITPSSAALNEAECNYLEEIGIHVTSQAGFLLSSPKDILCVKPHEIQDLILQNDRPESDAVLISCSGLHVMELIEPLEKMMKKPVIASNQFGLWGVLRSIGISDVIPGIGQLFICS